jgi:hypothetical protein
VRSGGANLVCAIACALALAGAAGAHGPRNPPGFISTVAEIDPPVLGLTARILDGDRLLALRNWSGKTVVVLDRRGAPLLRLDERGVFRRRGDSWRLVKQGTSHAFHDPRVHWSRPDPPASVRDNPDAPQKIGDWRVRGTADGRPFAIVGFLGWVPGDAAATADDDELPAWVVPAAVAAGVVAMLGLALPLVRRRNEAPPERGPVS